MIFNSFHEAVYPVGRVRNEKIDNYEIVPYYFNLQGISKYFSTHQ